MAATARSTSACWLRRLRPELALWLAIALMTAGLAAKTALFPVHIWLPPAHSGAPPAASALLSALVVKGSFFLIVRLWFDVAPGMTDAIAGQILGAMGAGAIVIGGVVALRQARLKLLIAYSTVAQIGYLFLIFPLAAEANALAGGMFQAISHAFAKAAMFMAAGLMAGVLGHDRIADLRGIGRALPVTVFAFGLAALSLVGVPPSGGFFTKWLLLSASFAAGQWWWAAVILAGGLLAGGYMFRALAPALDGFRNPADIVGARVAGSRDRGPGSGRLRVAGRDVSAEAGRTPSNRPSASLGGRAAMSHGTLLLAAVALPVAMLFACLSANGRKNMPKLALGCSRSGAGGRAFWQSGILLWCLAGRPTT